MPSDVTTFSSSDWNPQSNTDLNSLEGNKNASTFAQIVPFVYFWAFFTCTYQKYLNFNITFIKIKVRESTLESLDQAETINCDARQWSEAGCARQLLTIWVGKKTYHERSIPVTSAADVKSSTTLLSATYYLGGYFDVKLNIWRLFSRSPAT